eukprot:755177-Hanusia_phi.AAC.3
MEASERSVLGTNLTFPSASRNALTLTEDMEDKGLDELQAHQLKGETWTRISFSNNPQLPASSYITPLTFLSTYCDCLQGVGEAEQDRSDHSTSVSDVETSDLTYGTEKVPAEGATAARQQPAAFHDRRHAWTRDGNVHDEQDSDQDRQVL